MKKQNCEMNIGLRFGKIMLNPVELVLVLVTLTSAVVLLDYMKLDMVLF